MSHEMLDCIFAKTLGQAADPDVDYVWHGGEPLLLGKEYFDEVFEMQARYRQPRQRVTNSLQTNATLLDHEWIDLIEARNMQVGVSLDGPPDLHDEHRPQAAGRGTYDRTMAGIQLLVERAIEPSVLFVVTKRTVEYGAANIFRFFIANGLKRLAPLAQRPIQLADTTYSMTDEHISEKVYNNFLCDLFDAWLEHDDPEVRVRDFESIVRSLAGGRAIVCTLAGGCIGWNFAVEPTGEVYHCDHFVGNPAYMVGHIVNNTIEEITRSPKLQRLVEEDRARVDALVACPHFDLCMGGCPSDQYVRSRTIDMSYDATCCGNSVLIDHIVDRLGVRRVRAASPPIGPRSSDVVVDIGDSLGY